MTHIDTAAAPAVPPVPAAPIAPVAPAKAVAAVKKTAVKAGAPRAAATAKKASIPTPALPKPVAAKQVKDTKAVKDKPTKLRAPKIKMVRDSFTFPESDHKQLTDLKKRVVVLGHEVKKGELVRVGIAVLSAMDNKALLAAVAKVDKLKTGRPKK